jgi:hypothetical protein
MPSTLGVHASSGMLPQIGTGASNVTVYRDTADAKNITYIVTVPNIIWNNPTSYNYHFYVFGGSTLQNSSSSNFNAGTDDPTRNFMCEITVSNENGSITKTIGVFKSNVPLTNPTVWNYSW